MMQPEDELTAHVRDDEAGNETVLLRFTSRLVSVLDNVAKVRGMAPKEGEDPLRSRLWALGQLLAHGTTKAVYPLM
jgi:hypothetical protein